MFFDVMYLTDIKIFGIPTKRVFQEYINNSHIDFHDISNLFIAEVASN